MGYRQLTYRDILERSATSVLGLDISVHGTGWIKYTEGVFTQGVLRLKGRTGVERRREFREFIQEVVKGSPGINVYVEDTIQGENYLTTKILAQLNCIVDDLKDMGVINIGEITRVDNNKWKAELRALASYVPSVKGLGAKQQVAEVLQLLGYVTDEKKEGGEDKGDALGLVLGSLYRENIKGKEKTKAKAKGLLLKNLKLYATKEAWHRALTKEKGQPLKVPAREEVRNYYATLEEKGYYWVECSAMQLGYLAEKLKYEGDYTAQVYLRIRKGE